MYQNVRINYAKLTQWKFQQQTNKLEVTPSEKSIGQRGQLTTEEVIETVAVDCIDENLASCCYC